MRVRPVFSDKSTVAVMVIDPFAWFARTGKEKVVMMPCIVCRVLSIRPYFISLSNPYLG
jgi:hypothetical protein